jgi:uncharacterized membrane protein
VFAYAGAALSVLLLIDLSQRPLDTILTGEAIAQEIVCTVCSIGMPGFAGAGALSCR